MMKPRKIWSCHESRFYDAPLRYTTRNKSQAKKNASALQVLSLSPLSKIVHYRNVSCFHKFHSSPQLEKQKIDEKSTEEHGSEMLKTHSPQLTQASGKQLDTTMWACDTLHNEIEISRPCNINITIGICLYFISWSVIDPSIVSFFSHLRHLQDLFWYIWMNKPNDGNESDTKPYVRFPG